jgi:hypothetical protein
LLLGVLGCVLTRPAFSVLIPALILTYLFSAITWKQKLIKILLVFAISIVGIIIVLAIQYLYNNSIENFFTVQKGWGNFLQIPKLPLNSWGGGFNVRLDGFALLITILTGLFLLKQFSTAKMQKTEVPKEILFSSFFLIGIGLLILFFRGGSLFSLNRFVFATPFFIVILNHWLGFPQRLSKRQYLLIGIAILFFWFLFGSYMHFKVFLNFFALTFYVLLIFLITSTNKTYKLSSMITLIIVNSVFQLILFERFLSNFWVG